MKPRAFTIVELLVVVAILAVLAALLFPVFARARESGLRSTAISNVRQIYGAATLYQNDSDDQFVLYFAGLTLGEKGERIYGAPLSYWPQTVAPYLGAVRITPGSQQCLIQDLPRVFTDPKKGYKPQDVSKWPFGNVSSWGISDNIARWFCPKGVDPSFTSVDPSSVVSPADCLMFTETWDYYSPGHDLAGSAIAASYFDDLSSAHNGAKTYLDSPYAASYSKSGASQEPDPRGRNVSVFCDGHAKSLVTGSLTNSGRFWSVGNNDAWP